MSEQPAFECSHTDFEHPHLRWMISHPKHEIGLDISDPTAVPRCVHCRRTETEIHKDRK